MPRPLPPPLPTPVAAAIGLVPVVLGGVRSLPGRVVRIPILAASSALSALDAGRRSYDDLAERGERLVARLRGTTVDDVEDHVESALQGTPVAGLYDRLEDAAEDAVDSATRSLRAAEQAPEEDPAPAVEAAPPAATAAEAAPPAVPAAEAPKGAPTPKAGRAAAPRADTAASPETARAADAATGATGAVLAHDDLPLPDYDHMTLGSLRGRLRSLSLEQLGQVRAYEKAHAERLPVITMLDNRIAKVASDSTVHPTNPGAV